MLVLSLAAAPLASQSAEQLPVFDLCHKAAPGDTGDLGGEKVTTGNGTDAGKSITNVFLAAAKVAGGAR